MHWYLTEGNESLTVRIGEGLRVGEHSNGFLALDDSRKKNQWFRFYFNAQGELWIACLHQFVIDTADGTGLRRFRFTGDTKICLPGSEIFVSKDSFQIDENHLQITIRPVANQYTPYEEETLPVAERATVKAPELSVQDLQATGFFQGESAFHPDAVSNETESPFGSVTVLPEDRLVATMGSAHYQASPVSTTSHVRAQSDHHAAQTGDSIAAVAAVPVQHHSPASRQGQLWRPQITYLLAGIITGSLLSLALFAVFNLEKQIEPVKHRLDLPLASGDDRNTDLPGAQTVIQPIKPNATELPTQAGATAENVGQEMADKAQKRRLSTGLFPNAEDWRLTRARISIERGEIIAPAGKNAVAYLQSYLGEFPDSEAAAQLLRQCANHLINIAEELHHNGQLFDARNTLEEVLVFDRNNERASSLWDSWQGQS